MNQTYLYRLGDLESHLWESANILRGPVDAADFKTYIFPLLFFKRICDVWDEEFDEIVDETGDEALAWFPESHRFQIPEDCHWNDVRAVTSNVGAALQRAMREIEKANPDTLYGVFGDAQWTNKDRLSDALLKDLIEHFSRISFGNKNITSDVLGDAYEYLIKKFADATNKKAGEFYTPRSIVRLMIDMLDPKEGETIYDPACGTGGMLLAAVQHVKDRHGDVKRLWGKLYGQEKNLTTSSIARMNLFLHGIEDFQIVRGDTLRNPAFFEGDRLANFDCVIANPPFSLEKWGEELWINDPFGRNFAGLPPSSSGDFAWVQHMVKSMAEGAGRMAVVLPQGALFRKGAEGSIRQKLLEMDLVEAVIGLAPNLFYGTGLAACILVLRKKKPSARRKKVMIADASRLFQRGRAQNYLEPEHTLEIQGWFEKFEDVQDAARIVGIEEIKAEDWTLNISRYVLPPLQEDIPPLPEAIAAFKEALTRCREAEDRLAKVMVEGGWLDNRPPADNAVEDYVDERLGWHIHLERSDRTVEYVYAQLSTGEKIQGSAAANYFKSPEDVIRQHLQEQAERQALRDAGVTGEQISRRIMEMIGILHAQGYESLYIDPYMAPSGMAWRYQIGAMNAGQWPVPQDQLICWGSISGGHDQRLDWAKATDCAEIMADKFVDKYGNALTAARAANPEYVAWYREMLEKTKPEGTLIFTCDGCPDYEHALVWYEPADFQMPMPPGFSRGRGQ